MSYDLFFYRDAQKPPLAKEDFVKYFKGRPHFNVKKNQAWYGNERTGNYFSFEFQERASVDPGEDPENDRFYPVAFNMNYCRPHIFGLEAAPVVKNFVEELELNIFDPQMEGMGEGPFTMEGFINGWNQGNLFGIYAVGSGEEGQGFKDLKTLPAEDIERYWQWNFNGDKLQSKVGNDIFIPQIMFCTDQNQVRSFIVWGDAMQIALPRVDRVIIGKGRLAPLYCLFHRRPMLSMVTYGEVSQLFPSEETISEQGLPYKTLRYDRHPTEVIEFFKKQKPGKIQGCPFDQILDSELVEKAKESASSMEVMTLDDLQEERE